MDVNNSTEPCSFITEENLKSILKNYLGNESEDSIIENFTLHSASDKLLGFMGDYWKIKIIMKTEQNERQILSFFIKTLPKTNAAKAAMVKEMNMTNKEMTLYSEIKSKLDRPGLKQWSPNLICLIEDGMVLQDLNSMHYKCRNKHSRFDMQHTFVALRNLANFHASSIIYEEDRSKILQRPYSLNEDYIDVLDVCGYHDSSPWFVQCRDAALEIIIKKSKFSGSQEFLEVVKSKWSKVWSAALKLCDFSPKHRNVICHRDLWNNNILFHYKEVKENLYEPDDCLFVDYQAIRCHPPAGDVMILLICNLDPKLREKYTSKFLDYYYQELENILENHNLLIEEILPKDKFLISAEEQRLWGLVMCACLIPVFWLDDDYLSTTFSDTSKFDEALSKNKAQFILDMIDENDDYREKVLGIFEEIVEKYCM